MRHASLILSAALASLSLAACQVNGQQDHVRQGAQDLLKAIAEGNSRLFCAHIDRQSQHQIATLAPDSSGSDAVRCQEIASTYFSTLVSGEQSLEELVRSEQARLDNAEIEVKGDSATIIIDVEGGQLISSSFRAHRVGDRWLFRWPPK